MILQIFSYKYQSYILHVFSVHKVAIRKII